MDTIKNIRLKNIMLDLTPRIDAKTGVLSGMKLAVNPISSDQIYRRSDNTIVNYLPEDISFSLDMQSLISFNAMLLQTISKYLFNIRKKIVGNKDFVQTIKTTKDSEYFIEMKATRYFFRQKEKGRTKIFLKIIKKGDSGKNSEVATFHLTKRDVILLSEALKEITTSFSRGGFIPADFFIEKKDEENNDNKEYTRGAISIVDTSIVIKDTWLHGQEVLNLIYVTHELVNNIEDNVINMIRNNFRQTTVSPDNGFVKLTLHKMTKEQEETGDEYSLYMSDKVLSLFFLFLRTKMIRHSDFDNKTEDIGSSAIKTKGLRYHINTLESAIGFAVKDRKKKNTRVIRIVGKYRGELDTVNTSTMGKVAVLKDFDIDLGGKWVNLLRGLASAYSKDFIEKNTLMPEGKKREINFQKIDVINNTPMGRMKYIIKVISDPGNKADAVLYIEQYSLRNKGKDETLIATFRQPLFRRYLFQMISILLETSRELKEVNFLINMRLKDIQPFRYTSLKNAKKTLSKKSIAFGIKKEGDDTIIGNFSGLNTTYELNNLDKLLLSISSRYRIFHTKWIPFTGEKVSIKPEGHLVTLYSLIDMEKDYMGALWAIRLFAGTGIEE